MDTLEHVIVTLFHQTRRSPC